jgi:NAD(P)-dependent dehydrogenase (short-subunit alcohol dehydrogenase family)
MTGCFLMGRAVVPLMLEQGGGRIVTISMSEATMVRRGFVPYGPSGAAVEALSRVMAADLADSAVTVNLLLPGGATTPGCSPTRCPARPASGCSTPRSWDRRSSGSPRRRRPGSTTSGSSAPNSSSGWPRDEYPARAPARRARAPAAYGRTARALAQRATTTAAGPWQLSPRTNSERGCLASARDRNARSAGVRGRLRSLPAHAVAVAQSAGGIERGSVEPCRTGRGLTR